MCYDDKALPPDPPGEATPAEGRDMALIASDGNRFAAYLAAPSRPAAAQVIIYPDVRGLHNFYKELARRFAGVGISALALDYFGRTAGLTSRDDSFEYMPHVQQMQQETFTRDVQAGLDCLRAQSDAPVFVVGFCLGGGLALRTGTNAALGFAGLIAFYAGLSRPNAEGRTVLDDADKVVYPALGLFGGADTHIPEDQVKALDAKLDTAGVEHEIISYPGAPHSFFDRRAADFADASADAWKRILKFIEAHKGEQGTQRRQ